MKKKNNNNNNNNNNADDFIVCHQVIARVHSVHLVNVEQCQTAANPQTKPPDLGTAGKVHTARA